MKRALRERCTDVGLGGLGGLKHMLSYIRLGTSWEDLEEEEIRIT